MENTQKYEQWSNQAVAQQQCAAMGANVEMVESGEDKCQHESLCWKPGVANRSACNTLGNALRSGNAPFDRSNTWWDDGFDGSNGEGGICRLGGMEDHSSYPPPNGYRMNGHWGPNMFYDTLARQRQICEGPEFGGILYFGRRFEAGRYDNQQKCEASYCNVADRWWSNAITPDMCTEAKIGGKCDRCRPFAFKCLAEVAWSRISSFC